MVQTKSVLDEISVFVRDSPRCKPISRKAISVHLAHCEFFIIKERTLLDLKPSVGRHLILSPISQEDVDKSDFERPWGGGSRIPGVPGTGKLWSRLQDVMVWSTDCNPSAGLRPGSTPCHGRVTSRSPS